MREFLSKHFYYVCVKDEDVHYIYRIIWYIIMGYSLWNSIYYDFKTPKFIKKIVWKIQRRLDNVRKSV